MSDLERMATLDFVIGVLKQHEKTLDSIGNRLEKNLKDLRQMKRQTKYVLFSCTEWVDFREISRKADAVSYQVGQNIMVKALKGSFIYKFTSGTEPEGWALPREPEELRDRLAYELRISKKKIIQGELSLSP